MNREESYDGASGPDWTRRIGCVRSGAGRRFTHARSEIPVIDTHLGTDEPGIARPRAGDRRIAANGNHRRNDT